ncbi:MAG: DUF4386 domain-containing protein [Aurantibacter sp.]
MNSNQKTVKIVGILFLVQMLAAVLSYSVILEPILYKANFLNELSANSTMVIIAMLLDLICGASVFAIAILLFPILKHFNERVALWYVGQRLTEFMGFMVSGLLLLTLLKIGHDITNKSGLEPSHTEAIATYLRNARGNLQNIALLIYCLGAWSFYGLLFYARLLPRFISVWGLLGVTLLFIEIMANVFGTSAGGMMIMMPLGLNEIFLGIWLIAKGFRPSTLKQVSADIS